MPQPAPVDLSIIDADGGAIFSCSVPFERGMSGRGVLEQAFVESQSATKADPFAVTFAFYGYSQSAQYPGYLGYEVESFGGDSKNMLPTNDQFYWELFIDGQVATVGADLTRPNPGGSIRWTYVAVDASPGPSPRAALHAQRRAASR